MIYYPSASAYNTCCSRSRNMYVGTRPCPASDLKPYNTAWRYSRLCRRRGATTLPKNERELHRRRSSFWTQGVTGDYGHLSCYVRVTTYLETFDSGGLMTTSWNSMSFMINVQTLSQYRYAKSRSDLNWTWTTRRVRKGQNFSVINIIVTMSTHFKGWGRLGKNLL